MIPTTSPATETHYVLAHDGTGLIPVYSGTWNAAVGVWDALDSARRDGTLNAQADEAIKYLAVRSAADPQVADAIRYTSSYGFRHKGELWRSLERSASIAWRELRRKELGKIALVAVQDEELATLRDVLARVRRDAEHLDVKPFEVYEAVKARVHLGRTRRDARDRRAYFAPKGMGRLADLRAPSGERLYATSGSFQGGFTRLRAGEEQV